MRKVILILLALLTANVAIHSQNNEDTKPIMVIEKTKSSIKGNLAPAKVLVECFYYSYTNNLELSFLTNFGIVNVVLENQSTGETQDYVASSSAGKMVIPVESDCAYRMDITTGNGRCYYALFITGTDDENQ